MKLNIQLFANTITTTITDGIYDTQEGNYENKSYVGITAYFKSGSSETWFNSKTIYFYCKRVNPDGTETDITPINWDGNQKARTMTCSLSKGGSVSKTFYFYFVDHQTDGSLKVRCYWTINTGTSQLGNITESQTEKTQVMATIPRGSTFDLSGWNRDTQRNFSSTISLPAIQNLTTAYHKLEAKFYRQDTQQEQLIATRTFGNISGNSISFTFSNSELSTIYNLMPSETTHYIRMYLTTYSDSGRTHQVGDVSALWWTGLIPASVVPTATRTFAENGATPSAWNTYVKTKSKVRVITTTTPAYGSPITSITTTCDGYTYTGADFTSNYLNTAGTLPITTKITDSRGRSSTYTSNISVVDYYNPSFGTIQIQRCDVNGNVDDNGAYAYFYFNGSVAPCNNHNTGTFVIKYKIHSASVYTEKTISSGVSSLNTNGFITDNNNTKVQFSTTDSYDFIFYIGDYFTSSTTNKTLETGFDLINFNASGKALAFGKYSEAGANEELFEVGMPMKVIEPIVGQLKSSRATWWMGGRTDSIVKNTAKNSASYNPVIDVTATNGDYSFGTLGDSAFLVHTSDSDFTAQNNVTNNLQVDLSNGYYCDLNTSRSEFKFNKPVIVSGNFNANGTVSATGGNLTSSKSDRWITIANENTAYAHYQTSADVGHWFNKNVYVMGDVYAGSGYDINISGKYSSTKTAIGTWIDGNKIYRKVITLTGMQNGNNWLSYDLGGLNTLINVYGSIYVNGTWEPISRVVTDGINTYGIGVGDIYNGYCLLQIGTSVANIGTGYLVFEYT